MRRVTLPLLEVQVFQRDGSFAGVQLTQAFWYCNGLPCLLEPCQFGVRNVWGNGCVVVISRGSLSACHGQNDRPPEGRLH